MIFVTEDVLYNTLRGRAFAVSVLLFIVSPTQLETHRLCALVDGLSLSFHPPASPCYFLSTGDTQGGHRPGGKRAGLPTAHREQTAADTGTGLVQRQTGFGHVT